MGDKMDFSKIKRFMDEAVAEHEVPCSDIMIVYKGEVVYRYMNGTIDDEKKVPIKGDELYFLYSATKPITCTAVMMCWQPLWRSFPACLSENTCRNIFLMSAA